MNFLETFDDFDERPRALVVQPQNRFGDHLYNKGSARYRW
jgi:hypothetical protein